MKKNINQIQEKCRANCWNHRDRLPTLFWMKMRLFCFGIKRNSFLKGNISQEKCLRNFLGPRIVRDLALLKANVNVQKHWGSTRLAKVGDLISVPSELFDDSPGSYSKSHPGKCFGTVSSITKKGIAKIICVEEWVKS